MGEMKDGKGQVKYQEVANASVLKLQWVTRPGGVSAGCPCISPAVKSIRPDP